MAGKTKKGCKKAKNQGLDCLYLADSNTCVDFACAELTKPKKCENEKVLPRCAWNNLLGCQPNTECGIAPDAKRCKKMVELGLNEKCKFDHLGVCRDDVNCNDYNDDKGS